MEQNKHVETPTGRIDKTGIISQGVSTYGTELEVIRTLMTAGFHIDETTLVMASEQVSDPKLYIPATLAHF